MTLPAGHFRACPLTDTRFYQKSHKMHIANFHEEYFE
jgi:hypothetical protein